MGETAGGMIWGHLNVNVRDLDRATDFYKALGFSLFRDSIPYLGLEGGETREMDPGAAEALGLPVGTRGRARILELRGGFPKLDLTEFAEPAQDASAAPRGAGSPGLARFCLGLRDLDAAHARLVALGVRFVTPPRICHARMARIAVCLDPDGTPIELIEVDRARMPPPAADRA